MNKRKKEIDIKHDRIKGILDRKDLGGVIFASQTNFRWLSGGRLNNVIRNDDISLVFLFLTKDKRYLLASNSDAERVMTEELDGLDFELVKYRWYDEDYNSSLKKIGIKGKIGADFSGDGLVCLENEIASLRIDLCDFEIKKYISLCKDYSKIITDYCLSIKRGSKEIEVAANINDICFKRGIRLPVLMVGSDERVYSYRHPCFTNKKIDKYILIATCAERDGIYANVSRSIYFGKTPRELIEKQKAVNYIYSVYFAKAMSEATLGELFEAGKTAYMDAGFPDEWKNHLQGGISGYKPLEYSIDKNSTTRINTNNILGFNPTIKGVKTEDPVLIKDGDPHITVFDKRWPFESFKINEKVTLRPLILEL